MCPARECICQELFSRCFWPSSRCCQRCYLFRTALCVPMPLCNTHQNKARLHTYQEFVLSSEATSHHDTSQGACIRYFHSVACPLPQNQTHTFCSCQSLWQRHYSSETSNKLLTVILYLGNQRPINCNTRQCLPASQGHQMQVLESTAWPQPSTTSLTKPAG